MKQARIQPTGSLTHHRPERVMRFRSGERVKLIDGVAKAWRKGGKRVDWPNRRGYVEWANNNDVMIVWDGRRSGDLWPIRAVERVQA